MITVDPFLRLFAAKLQMNSSANVPYWVVAVRVSSVLSQVVVAGEDLSQLTFELPTLTLHL